jgi:uncharacterized protein (TIGR00255 family)
MIRSMTGFASVSREEHGERVSVTVKSVNHRYLDAVVKAPSSLGALEASLKALVQERVTRGRVECSVSVDATAAPAREVVLDEALLDRVAQALESARARGFVAGALSASDILRIPGVLEIRQQAADPAGPPETMTRLVHIVATEALDALVAMRETEGRFLGVDLETRLTTMSGMVDRLEALARDGQSRLDARLRERIAGLPADLALDPTALTQEVVRFVARSDVDEEIVRMRGHVDHWRALATGPEPCGRKLDFLAQEMNREINTIGSKIEGAGATEIVIAAKAELERVREQVQNVE